jgi:hypothetical protein
MGTRPTVAVAGLRDVSREEHNTGDCHARDQISGRVDPEYGIRSEQNVPKSSAANSCHRPNNTKPTMSICLRDATSAPEIANTNYWSGARSA